MPAPITRTRTLNPATGRTEPRYRPCRTVGCPVLLRAPSTLCPDHDREHQADHDHGHELDA